MNILIIHNYNVNEQENELIFEHIKEWSKSAANVWVISKNNFHPKYHQSNIRFKKLPSFIPYTISFYLWYVTNFHPNFDVIIDASKNIPFYFQNVAKIKTVLYFSQIRVSFINSLKKYNLKLLQKYIFRSRYILFSNLQAANETMQQFESFKLRYMVMKGVPNKVRKFRLAKNKDLFNLIFVHIRGNLNSNANIYKVFEAIVRKNEGWNLWIFGKEAYFDKKIITNLHPLFEYNGQIFRKKLNDNFSFMSLIPKNSILLDISEDGTPIKLLQTFAMNGIPFVTIRKNEAFREIKNFYKLVYTSGDVGVLSERLLDLSRNDKMFEKIKNVENNWATNINGSGNIYSESLNFVETV